MTTPEMIVQLWESEGEPTDLNPWLDSDTIYYDPNTDLDPTSEGVAHYLRVLSQAQVLLSNWKGSDGRPIRFRDFLTQANVKLTQDNTTFVCTRVNDYSIQISGLPPTSYLMTDAIESARSEITLTSTSYPGGIPTPVVTTDTLMVMFVEPDPVAGTVILHFREPLSTHSFTPTGSVTFSFDRFEISANARQLDSPYVALPSTFRNIMKVIDMDNGVTLKRAPSKENLYNYTMSTGVPTMWYCIGNRIYFDVYFEEPRWFTIEYQRLPAPLTDVASTPDIPEQWHEVLIVIGEYIAAKRLQQHDLVAVKFSHIGRLINSLRTDTEEDFVRGKTGGLKIQREAD